MTDGGASVQDPYYYWMRQHTEAKRNIRYLGRHDPLMIAGILCSLHGDQGANGARSSRRSMAKLGVKTVTAHTHQFWIEEGSTSAATSTPRQLEYTGPITSWLQGHISIDPMGKRHIHVLVDGKFWKAQKLKRAA